MHGILAAAAALLGSSAMAADIVVNLTGAREGGTVYLQLQTGAQFGGEETYREAVATGQQISVIFEDVEPGEYALTVWHDLNDNGIFDMSDFGFPLDGFSASNADTLFGPPTWANQKFSVEEDTVTLTEPMRYMTSP